jgi:hypothetical protein
MPCGQGLYDFTVLPIFGYYLCFPSGGAKSWKGAVMIGNDRFYRLDGGGGTQLLRVARLSTVIAVIYGFRATSNIA